MQMTADSSAGAASHLSTDWHAIPWKTVNETVRRLQARIVQATKAGKWHKVQALQHLLTHSFSGKALAVRRVTENQGKNTPTVSHLLTPIAHVTCCYYYRFLPESNIGRPR